MNEESSMSTGRSFRKRKRSSRPSWKDLPAYLDKSATVSVSLFASRRLPELKDLQVQLRTASKDQAELSCHDGYQPRKARRSVTVQPEDALLSGGAKTSSRHLRRRTTAVERKKHKHRFPRGDHMSSSQSTTRKGRRGKKSTIFQGHLEWRHGKSLPSVASTNETPNTSRGNLHWMVTHLWHAKRFHMETLWGWRVPVCHSNRGARSMLRLEQEKRCSLQDITWKRQTVAISSTLPLSSMVPLLSRICPDFASSQSVLAGIQMGSGMLHHLDQFPMQAIGPTHWKLLCEKEAKELRWIVQFFVHPSIYADLVSNLQQIIVEESRVKFEESPEIIGNSCFQVCGSSATSVIQSVLQPKQDDKETPGATNRWKWSKVPTLQEAEACLPDGSVFHVKVNLFDSDSKRIAKSIPLDDESPALEGLKAHMNQVQRHLEKVNLENGESLVGPTVTETNEMLLIWQAPRKLNCVPNRAVSGWEIHCADPSLAQSIWMKLVLAGPCCPMGMTEESHLNLECSPPIPLFPRDYVDTEQGQLYWQGKAQPKTEDSQPSWNFVRRVWEGGWGRLPVKCASFDLSSVHWNHLVSIEDDSKEDGSVDGTTEGGKEDEDDGDSNGERDYSTVVVRGAFIQPFLQVLQGCGQQPVPVRSHSSLTQKGASDGTKKSRKRNRRRARPLNEMQKAQPLPKEQSDAWKEGCFGLRSSLSLPALLVCHIQVADRGVLQSVDQVYFGSISLGYVTTSSFSLSRGTCHGLAVVGAARLLHALESSGSNDGRHVRLLDGSRSLQLAVSLLAGDMRYHGSLSII